MLSKYVIDEILKKLRFLNGSNLKLLDIGCDSTLLLYDIGENYTQFNQFVAINKDESEFYISNLYGEFGNKSVDELTWQIYKNHEYKRFQSFSEYVSHFKFINKSIEELNCTDFDNKYSVIIMSNIIHFLASESEVINFTSMIASLLDENGFIYLNVANKDHKHNEDSNKTTFDKNFVKKCFQNKTIEYFKEIEEGHIRCFISN